MKESCQWRELVAHLYKADRLSSHTGGQFCELFDIVQGDEVLSSTTPDKSERSSDKSLHCR